MSFTFKTAPEWLKLVSNEHAVVLGAIYQDCIYNKSLYPQKLSSRLTDEEIAELVQRKPECVARSIEILESSKLITTKQFPSPFVKGFGPSELRNIYPTDLAIKPRGYF